jgi:hypothetical protein
VKLRDTLTAYEAQLHDLQIELAGLLSEPCRDDEAWFRSVGLCGVAMMELVYYTQHDQYHKLERAITASHDQFAFLKAMFLHYGVPKFSEASDYSTYRYVSSAERPDMVALTYGLLSIAAAKTELLLPFYYHQTDTSRPVASKQALGAVVRRFEEQVAGVIQRPKVEKTLTPRRTIYHALYEHREQATLKHAILLGEDIHRSDWSSSEVLTARTWLAQHGFPADEILALRNADLKLIVEHLKKVSGYDSALQALSLVNHNNHSRLRTLQLIIPLSEVLRAVGNPELKMTRAVAASLNRIETALLADLPGTEKVALVHIPLRTNEHHLYHYICAQQFADAVKRTKTQLS